MEKDVSNDNNHNGTMDDFKPESTHTMYISLFFLIKNNIFIS